MNLLEADKPKVTQTIVVYGGRFQPFHKGHYAAYEDLVSTFGKQNVYIGTSNDTSSDKSPFTFKEKKEIATKMFGIPASRFVKVNNPYRPVEILSKYDGKITQYIAAVGEKDASRLKSGYFKPYKGKAGYGYDEVGYYYSVPAEANPISGTDVRKKLGSSNKEVAKKFFLKAYPSFDREIFKMITSKLNEDGMPGGIGVGLVLPGGYINGAPTGSVTELVSGYELNPYDPIAELVNQVVTEEAFNQFMLEYLGEESEAEKMGLKHLGGGYYAKDDKGPATHKSQDGKVRTLTPQEMDAEKNKQMSKGPNDSPANQPGQPVKKGDTAQGKSDSTKEKGDQQTKQETPPEQKLGGVDLKLPAEMSDKERKANKTQETLDAARKEMSAEENNTIDTHNNPESPERKSMVDKIKEGFQRFGNGIKNWYNHKKEMVGGTIDGVVSIATTGKLGSVKDKDGKRRHWTEFAEVGRGGKPEMEYTERDEIGKDGNPTGKKIGEHRPKISQSATDEEKELFEKSYKESQKQKKDMIHFAIDAALILTSMAVGGAGVAVVKAMSVGSSVVSAAATGAASAFTHGVGGFAVHLGKDIAKHASLEALGLGASSAAGVGAGLSTATLGILEMINEGNEPSNGKFVSKFMGNAIEKMKTYKLSDEQLLQSIESYKKNQSKGAAVDLVKENLSETKQQSIQNFVEYATKKLKLNKTPKITLLTGREYSKAKTSLGGYNPMSKEIYVAIEGRLTADILRTIAHEMVHRKQDELGLVKDEIKDGATGSPIENQAHAVAGILMRNYGKINKQIYNESINIDVDKGDTVLMGKFKNKKVVVKDIGKDDYGMPTINGKKAATFRLGGTDQNVSKKDEEMDELYNDIENFINNYLDEVSGATSTAAEIPDGAFTQKGKKRKLNGDKPEEWYTNGGYTQTDFPKADAIFGDDDAEERIITYTIKNLPNVDYVETDFIKEGLLMEGGAYGHMSHPFDDMDLTFGDLKDIISKALNGELGVVREKTDGQALAISWKNGRLIAARNKGHLQNAGANAMGIEDVASKFGGRGGLTDAYNFAMRDLSAAISGLSDSQRKKIFNEGKCFMNLEVIWPTSVNVIPYGQALLVFHNTTCYDEKGTAIGADGGAAGTLAGMIKQINADVQSKYTIQGPPITSIPKSENLSSKQGKYISKLAKLQKQFDLSDSDNVANYHQAWWENFINKNAPIKVDKLTKEALVRRWAFGDKGFRLTTISKPELQEWAIDHDKVNVAKQQKENIKPFEEIFLGVGADILEFVGSVLTVHPEKAIRAMKEKFVSVATQVRNGGNPAQIQKLKSELKRLNQLGGIDKIVANEGLVFFYNGKTYKLTGTFAPLNQILGIFYS